MAPKITLYGHGQTPNPLKVAILLEELNVEYDIVSRELGDGPNGVKGADFLKINPNGRVPAIVDHTNNDKIVWESGAILLYIAERFDPTGKLIGKSLEERAEVWEWLFFQVSGLGPSQGQAVWFLRNGAKDLHPSVVERYQNETYRIFSVLEKRLEDAGEWIALKRFTVVDIANYPWLNLSEYAKLDLSKYPKLHAYHARIQAIPSVKKAYAKLAPAS